MNAKLRQTRSSTKAEKWGPSEWFGVDVFAVDDLTRLGLARDALRPYKLAKRICPYQTALTGVASLCSKVGGICSVQRYSEQETSIAPTGPRVAICPRRIISKSVLFEIFPNVIGQCKQPVLVKEVPYSVSLVNTNKSGKAAYGGRIDWLLVDQLNPEKFFALETQSVYMSGKSQNNTFKAFVKSKGALTPPPDNRHPDYKSSVPKRLAPQLESKARHLSATSRKTVVIVDEFVFQNMHELREVSIPNALINDEHASREHKLNACEVIFAIVALDSNSLRLVKFLYCSIVDATNSLNALSAMSKSQFEQIIKDLVLPTKSSKGSPKVIPL